MVTLPCIGCYVIDIAFLVVIELREAGIELRFERIQIHRIGIEDILIDHLRPIPTLCHVYLVGVCLLCLFVTLTDDIGLLSGIDSIGVAIVAIVELLHSAS